MNVNYSGTASCKAMQRASIPAHSLPISASWNTRALNSERGWQRGRSAFEPRIIKGHNTEEQSHPPSLIDLDEDSEGLTTKRPIMP